MTRRTAYELHWFDQIFPGSLNYKILCTALLLRSTQSRGSNISLLINRARALSKVARRVCVLQINIYCSPAVRFFMQTKFLICRRTCCFDLQDTVVNGTIVNGSGPFASFKLSRMCLWRALYHISQLFYWDLMAGIGNFGDMFHRHWPSCRAK